MRLRQRLHPVGDRGDLVALQSQGPFQGVTDGAVVFSEQHSVGHPSIVAKGGDRTT